MISKGTPIYNLDNTAILDEYQTPINKTPNLISLEEYRHQLSKLLDYDDSDREFLALYLSSFDVITDGYTTARAKVCDSNSTLIYGDKLRKDFKKTEGIISPLSGKRLGQIEYYN
jgi:hypothetical protein